MPFSWEVVSIGEWGVFITVRDSLLSCVNLFGVEYCMCAMLICRHSMYVFRPWVGHLRKFIKPRHKECRVSFIHL